MDQPSTGQLVLVATPLGNLGDLSPRALATLRDADVVYCEDTRHSRTLFSANHLEVRGRLEALHEHNEAAMSVRVVERVRAGQAVALICDAGTPGISDPGTRVVAAVSAAGLRVTTVPGPSAVVAALTLSGLASERFVMEGFLPRKAGERARRLLDWEREERTIVFYESPQRVAGVLREMAERFPDRAVAVARELTKVHEEVVRGSVRDVAARLSAREVLGEIVVVLAGADVIDEVSDDALAGALAREFAKGASTRDAVETVSDLFSVARRRVYELALRERAEGE